MTPFERADQYSFHHRLEELGGNVLVIFTGPACGACRRMKAVLGEPGALPEGTRLLEVDAGIDMALTNEFEVFHLPALFLFRDGRFHAPVDAEPLPVKVREAVAAALAAPPQEAP